MNEPKIRFPEFTGEWVEKKLGEVLDYEQPQRYLVNSENYKTQGIPVLTAGKTFILGYTDETEGVYSNLPVIIFDDFVTESKFVTFPFKAKSSAMKMLKLSDENNDLRMIYESMQMLKYPVKEHKRYWISEYSQLKILLPSLPEQQKIASCLSELDALIEAQGKKVGALKEKKKGMMQQLFPQPGETTPRLRFPGFTGEWVEKKLGEVFTRLTDRNIEDNKNVLTISAQFGLISQLDFFKKSVASADVTGYYLLQKGDFAYNKSSSQGKPVGAIKPLKLYDKGVVSTLYICFKCNDSREIDFWEQYFDAGILDKEIMSIAQEGARNHGLLNVPTGAFFELKLISPSLPEQQKIAECLSGLDALIADEAKQLDALKEHKKGLMQQLFPQPTK